MQPGFRGQSCSTVLSPKVENFSLKCQVPVFPLSLSFKLVKNKYHPLSREALKIDEIIRMCVIMIVSVLV